MADAYDIVVVGAGTGGYSTALRAAQLGKRVAIVERDDRLGGTCLLRGCIPTKALLQSAAVMDTVNRSEEWGIKASGDPDWSAVRRLRGQDRRQAGQRGHRADQDPRHRRSQGNREAAPRARGRGRRHKVDAGDVVIASGSRPRLLPGLELTERIITSDEALGYDRIPSSAVVIGAGAVGLEFASLYRSLGAEVTVLEALPRSRPSRTRTSRRRSPRRSGGEGSRPRRVRR